jgi:DNA helicase II / ATP-dependent DNA helicase PcrA
MRASNPVVLETSDLDGPQPGANVAIATTWKVLWETDAAVLPLGFPSSTAGTLPHAAAVLLLDVVARERLGLRAVNFADAQRRLGLEAELRAAADMLAASVLDRLASTPDAHVREAYDMLRVGLAELGCRPIPNWNHNYRDRLRWLGARVGLQQDRVMIPGLTTHQAKGREWPVVALALDESEVGHLAAGLRVESEKHRQLYVAATRARRKTFLVGASAA